MLSTPLDVTAARNEQRAIWDAVSAGWQRWQPVFERGGRQVTALLLDRGGVRPGLSVLDVGTGLGEPALTAAGRVGPTGRVLAIDPSPAMITAARAQANGLESIEFAVGDVETLDLPAESFDVVLSRWALMFAADRVAALRHVARLLKPRGVLSAAVWGPPQAVPMISLAFSVISRRLSLHPQPPGLPGPFAMSDHRQLTAELTEAGFHHVELREQVVPFQLDSLADFVSFAQDVLPPRMKQLLHDRCGSADDAATWEAVGLATARYAAADGRVSLPSRSIIIRAVAGAA